VIGSYRNCSYIIKRFLLAIMSISVRISSGRICSMNYLLVVITVIILTFTGGDASARNSYQSEEEASNSAKASFEQILDLWRDGRYDDLYERTQRSGKTAKEDFGRKLENGTYKPACCWQKMQDVSVHLENDAFAVVRAKIGLENGSDVTYKTRSYKLVREGDAWRISQSDLFSLAGAKKATKGHKKKN
jgi:hypothetical protein